MNKATIILIFAFITLINPAIFCQLLTSSNHPIIVINTNDEEIPDEPKINATMGIIYNGEGQINNATDPFNHYNGSIGIETRGNSTQGFDKKTYSIELRDAFNNDLSVNLFGMGGEEDWILHAMVIDKSQVRIPMSFYFSQQMGHYASEWKYVELILNEEYRGLYILTEKIKRDDDRVDIAKLDEDDLAGDSLTGGYILRIDWLHGLDWETDGFESAYDSQGQMPMFFQWYYPKSTKIKPQQAQYIKNWMADFEEAVFSSNYTNSQGIRYNEYIDLNSFTDFLLINELSKNSDGYKLSSYLHKDRDSRGGKLVAGPIWDFDQTYGVSRVCSNDDYTGWTYLQNQGCEDLESMPMWWQKMMEDEFFQNHLQCRWKTFRQSFLHKDAINNWMETNTNFISAAIERNFTIWDDFIGNEIWIEPFPIPQSYDEEIVVLKNWISNRIDWLDTNLPGTCASVHTSDLKPKGVKIEVFPNPTNDKVIIQAEGPVEVELLNPDGRTILRSDSKEINFNHLHAGIYLVRIETKKQTITKKIIKQ